MRLQTTRCTHTQQFLNTHHLNNGAKIPCDQKYGRFIGTLSLSGSQYRFSCYLRPRYCRIEQSQHFVLRPRLAPAFSVSKDAVQLVGPAGQLIGWQLPFMKGE